MTIVLFLAWAFQDPDALIRQLESTDPAHREKATQDLIEMGPPILGKLRAQPEAGDAEVRARVQHIVAEIDRIERLRVLRPKPTLLTLSLKEELLPDALRKVFAPFGIDAEFERGSEARKRKVSLDLKEATLWKAFDTVCAAGHVQLSWFSMNLGEYFSDGEGGISLRSHQDVGELRFMAKQFIREGKHQVQVHVAMPPSFRPLSQTIEDIAMIDDQGKRMTVEKEIKPRGFGRHKGNITVETLWDATFVPTPIKDWKKVRIEGILVQEYPHNLERITLDMREEDKATNQVIYGCRVGAQWKRTEPMGIPPRVDWHCRREWESDVNSLKKTFFDWVEDTKGDWIADGGGFESRRATSSSSGGFSGRFNKDAPPAAFVVGVVEGRDELKIPFVITDFDGPPKPEK
jgi:hypothetical protein